MPAPYFFLRPLLAPDRSWVALDWWPEPLEEMDSSALLQCYADSAASPLAHALPLVVPIPGAFLLEDDFLKALKSEPITFVLPESCLDNGQVIERCKALRVHARPLALQIETMSVLSRIPPAAFSAVRFNAALAGHALYAAELNQLGGAGFRRIATNVNSYEQFEWLSKKNVEWSNGHFLTKPNPQFGKEPDLARLKLLKLLNLVRQDGDTKEIEEIFRTEAKLSYNLLRLVNSVSVGARTKISNFSQAIAILGRRQLQRWVQLLIYANNLADGNAPNPLMQLAAARGRQMELLSGAIDPMPDIPELPDNAFMAGLFSLLDVLLNLPMEEILKEIPLQDDVVDALSNPGGNGILAQLLTAITRSEAGDLGNAASSLAALGIDPTVHARAQVTAFYWASRINADQQD